MATLARAVCALLSVAAACAAPGAAVEPATATATEASAQLRLAHEWDTAEDARRIIRKNEALRLQAYPEGERRLIGYGHVMDGTEPSNITEAEAERLLTDDLQICEQAVEEAVSVPVTQNEFSALVSLCHNIGSGAVRTSTAVRRLNEGDREGAAEAILLWNKADGVVLANLADRRQKERDLFLARDGFAVASAE